jgi:hypothetical protein
LQTKYRPNTKLEHGREVGGPFWRAVGTKSKHKNYNATSMENIEYGTSDARERRFWTNNMQEEF